MFELYTSSKVTIYVQEQRQINTLDQQMEDR